MTATSKKTSRLSLTSRAKMGKARKPTQTSKKPLSLRESLRQIRDEAAAANEQAHVSRMDACAQAVEQVVEQVVAGIGGLDGDAGIPAAQIGEVPAAPAKAEAKAGEPVAKVDAALLALLTGILTRPEGATLADLMTVGLSRTELRTYVQAVHAQTPVTYDRKSKRYAARA
jgi:DNA-binding IclR family transcriptional regulator